LFLSVNLAGCPGIGDKIELCHHYKTKAVLCQERPRSFDSREKSTIMIRACPKSVRVLPISENKMKILRDFVISLTPEYVLEEQYHRRQKPVRPWMLEATKEAIALSETLVTPAAIYDEFPMRDVSGEQVSLAANGSEEKLAVGPKADLLAPAEQVLVAVLTIGPALEQRVHELQTQGEHLLSYMLDSVGVLALGAVGETMRRLAEEQAVELGWGLSPALSPGSLVGWPLRGQRELCALLPLEKIGVQLNNHYVLEPHKSVSVLIGMGAGYESNHVGSVCRYCSLADSCWRRREDAA